MCVVNVIYGAWRTRVYLGVRGVHACLRVCVHLWICVYVNTQLFKAQEIHKRLRSRLWTKCMLFQSENCISLQFPSNLTKTA